MLELLGAGYITDAIIAAAEEESRGEAFMVYTSDALYAIARILGADMRLRFADILRPTPVDNRTGYEIAAEVIQRAGLKFADDNADS